MKNAILAISERKETLKQIRKELSEQYEIITFNNLLDALDMLRESDFDIILLDEPTNALDESGITMLENVIQDETSRGATIVMASHDMNFLHHCCSKIYTMRAGTLSL